MMPQPPKAARKFFELVSRPARVDDLQGDLDERFYDTVKNKSLFTAQVQYWKDVLSLCFSYALRKRRRDARSGPYAGSSGFSMDMIRSYFKVAWRNLYQHRYFSVLNAFGLAIGMSVSLLLISIYSYVSTYDTFHANRDNIYTIISERHEGVNEEAMATAPVALASRLRQEFSGAVEAIRISRAGDIEVQTTKENIPLRTYYADPDFFRVFTFEILRGSAAVLERPDQVILTESAALKLFGRLDILGETIGVSDRILEVGGVMRDHPVNSHLTFEAIVSHNSINPAGETLEKQWTEFQGQYVYVLLGENTSAADLANYLSQVQQEIYAGFPVAVSFEPLHLLGIAMGPDLRYAIGTKWEASGFLMFAVFALLILLPACFNYTNLSIARAIKRAKEIGLRKTMGGVRNQIFFQFIAETILIALISLVGALLIFMLIRSEFQSLLVSGASLDLSLNTRTVVMFVVFALGTGVIAGFVPAAHFARLDPIRALKSKITGKGTAMGIRKTLSVLQFALSFGFILALIVFNRQYRYSVNFDFGFQRENIVNLELQDVDQQQAKHAFSQLSAVQSISMSSDLPGVGASTAWIKNLTRDSVEVSQVFVDGPFMNNFGLTLLAGRTFPDEVWNGERFIIVNEEFLADQRITHPSDIIGKTYEVEGKILEVIGVVKNFHYRPLMFPVSRFFFRMDPNRFRYVNLRVSSTDPFEMFSRMEEAWKELPTSMKFRADFFDNELQESYQTYVVLLKIVGFMGILAITISLLGMLGMVVFTAESKTREVGIRKVMGASPGVIAMMLSKDYLKMMAIAIAIAIPVTVWILDIMMGHIQYYHASISAWDIVISTLIVSGLGLLTIASQTWRTASVNPVDTLRSE